MVMLAIINKMNGIVKNGNHVHFFWIVVDPSVNSYEKILVRM